MKIIVDKKAVGLRIKQFRLNKGYTLEEFGKLFNTAKSNVYRWENGTALPNKERLKQITKFAGLTVNELLYGSVEEFIKNNYEEIIKSGVSLKEKLRSQTLPFDNFLPIFNSVKEELYIDDNWLNDLNKLSNIVLYLIDENVFANIGLDMFRNYYKEVTLTGRNKLFFETVESLLNIVLSTDFDNNEELENIRLPLKDMKIKFEALKDIDDKLQKDDKK